MCYFNKIKSITLNYRFKINRLFYAAKIGNRPHFNLHIDKTIKSLI